MNTLLILEKLIQGMNLSSRESSLFLEAITGGTVPTVQIASFLTALRIKGETSEEVVGFVRTMRKYMTHVRLPRAIDVCGTGGDESGTFNISTAVAIVVAGAGANVAKHGNRAASSKCGSADVLEALGVNIQLNATQATQVFKKVGLVFLFAPLYHSAMKYVSQTRKDLKVRTIFNILGPLCNPASVSRQIIGVPNEKIAGTLAKAALKLSYTHLCIVTAEHMDELSISSRATVFEVKNKTLKKYTLDPKQYGFRPSLPRAIGGGDARKNASLIKNILDGKRGACRDIVLFNSALAIVVSGKATTIQQGIDIAKNSIDSGMAKHTLETLIVETRKYV